MSNLWQWLATAADWITSLWQWLVMAAGNGMSSLWLWTRDLSQGQGSLIGSSIGLVAILIGALFNAHLNRKRDDRLRREDRVALTAALLAELGGFRDRLQSNVDGLKQKEETGIIRFTGGMLRARVLPGMISKLGLLDGETVRKVITAYNVAEEYEKVMRFGADKGVSLDFWQTNEAITLTEFALDTVDTAIVALGGRSRSEAAAEPSRLRRTWRWLRTTG